MLPLLLLLLLAQPPLPAAAAAVAVAIVLSAAAAHSLLLVLSHGELLLLALSAEMCTYQADACPNGVSVSHARWDSPVSTPLAVAK